MTKFFAMPVGAFALAFVAAPVLADGHANPAGHADHAVAAAVTGLSVETSDLGTLLDNPASKAVLEKHMPEMANNPQIEMARPMTLKQIQGFAPDMITDELLAKVEADLKAIK